MPDMAPPDSTLNITSIVDVELTMDRHAKTETKILSSQEDTTVFNGLEKTENISGLTKPNVISGTKPKPNHFLLGMLFPFALIGLILIVLMFVRPRKY
jgi:hypothetical protein